MAWPVSDMRLKTASPPMADAMWKLRGVTSSPACSSLTRRVTLCLRASWALSSSFSVS